MNTTFKKHLLILFPIIMIAMLVLTSTLICGAQGFAYAADNAVATVEFDGVVTEYTTVGEAFTYADGLATEEEKVAKITLLADVTTDGTLTVSAGKFITLDLNGNMLKYVNDSESSSVITVEGNFTLEDSEKDFPQEDKTEHKYYVSTDDNTKGLWVFVNDDYEPTEGQTLNTFYGGVITGGRSGSGGGVRVNTATSRFTMISGAICGNLSGGLSGHGGGVSIDNGGTFVMEGGTISGNRSVSGGGVNVGPTGNNTFTLKGGTITENVSGTTFAGSGYSGGGVFVSAGSNMNKAFYISGAPVVWNNYKVTDDGNIANNVYFSSSYGNKTSNIIGALEQDGKKAKIGVVNSSYDIAVGFTSANNPSGNKPSEYFFSDDEAYGCVYISNEESGTVSVGEHTGGTATCTRQATCTLCGESYGSNDPNNHKILTDWLDSSAGTHYHPCQYGCATLFGEESHNFNEEVASDYYLQAPATCEHKAIYFKSCTECGATGEATFEDEDGTFAEHTHAPAVAENVVEATCSKVGSYDDVVYCSVCNIELSRTPKTIDKLSHDEKAIPAVAATCTTTGLTEGKHCSVCGTITLPQTTVEATGHDYGNWIVTKEPTVDETGEEQRICSHDSSHVETRPIAKLPAQNNNGEETPKNELSAGAKAGISIGVIIFLVLVAYVVCYFAVYRTGLAKGKILDIIFAPMNAIFGKKKKADEQVDE